MIDQILPQPRITFVVDLCDLTRSDAPHVGAKAANLGELARAGFAVPEGFILTTAAFACFLEANALNPEHDPNVVAAAPVPTDVANAVLTVAARFGDAALAVRSSGVAEDLPDASFAGQHETVLDVRGPEALLGAVRRCWASAFGERAAAYRAGRDQAGANMAVLVQRQIHADAAGVAFTANPVTGNREETLVSAVRGLGERLVSGQASPDEWIVRGTEVVSQVVSEGALTAEHVRAVADLARRVEAHLDGVPQDIEWAIAGSELFLLQARPISALPEHVAWQVPGPGGWARHFRIGEWLGDPVTPLFATWLLPRLDERFWLQNHRLIGIPPRPQPPYALINGWFFTSVSMWTYSFAGTLWALARHPKALRLAALMSPSTARGAAEPFIREWREVALPRYRALVQTGAARVGGLPAADLVTLIDEVATAAGDYFVWLALVGGTGWKTEVPLARFYRQHLAPRIGGSHQRLLQGLPSALPAVSAHAVHSLDWFHPTLGESGGLPPSIDFAGRRARLAAERRAAEAAARTALVNERKLLKEFERLLATAQHFAALREEVMSAFTLGWPLMRRALLRL
jgi:pyruvate,water dikinase